MEKRGEQIIPELVEDEMKEYFLNYAMSVIVSRALPDVRDGLKPVHRRILTTLHDLNLEPGKNFRKCAKICGDVSGNYHPHGEAVVYPSLVRLAQPFSLRYPLVDGQGNFGSVDGDNPAAMRYTEARMKKLTQEMLADLEKDTVDYVPNYDGTRKEPTVLPSKFPNLLVNGSSGIAVGMATNIPPHNAKEVCEAVVKIIDNPESTVQEVMQVLPAPDFPTGGIITNPSGIRSAYTTGRGKILVRAKVEMEEKAGKQHIIVSEIPYMVQKAALIQQIAQLVRDKKIDGIADLRDESDREGMRIVITLKQAANSDIVQNQLFKHTRMQETFGIIMLALVNNEPKVLDIKAVISHFIDHRLEVITRRTQFDLNKAEKRAHILEGLIIALDDIERAIELIKKSKSADEAKANLISTYSLTDVQAKAILEMRLQRLTALEQDKLRKEKEELLVKIEELKSILASEEKRRAIIKDEMRYTQEKYGDERRTVVLEQETQAFEDEDLLTPEDVVVTMSHLGYVKRLPIDTYKAQRRGGRGIVAAKTRDEDFIENVFVTNTHTSLLCFTTKGKVHWIKVYQLPTAGRQAKGTAMVNILQLDKGERVQAVLPVKDFNTDSYVCMATKKGIMKKTELKSFSNPRKGGIIALSLDDDDELVNARLTSGNDELFLASESGMAVKCHEKEIRPMGRTARGVIGMRLTGDDKVIGMVIPKQGESILTVTEKGYGKRTAVTEYRTVHRGAKGVINIKTTERNGKVVAIRAVSEKDEIMIISDQGIAIRTAVTGISQIGRNTQGVRVMRVGSGKVGAVAKIESEE